MKLHLINPGVFLSLTLIVDMTHVTPQATNVSELIATQSTQGFLQPLVLYLYCNYIVCIL